MKKIIGFLLIIFSITVFGVDLKHTDTNEIVLSIVDYLSQEYGKKYPNPLPIIVFVEDERFDFFCGHDCKETDALYIPIEAKDYFGQVLFRERGDLHEIEWQALLAHELIHWIQHIEKRFNKCGTEVEAYIVQNKFRVAHGLKPIEGIQERCKDPHIVADKKNGTITVIYSSGEQVVSPALYGARKTDELDINIFNTDQPSPRITPSGKFKVKKTYSEYLHSQALIFIEGTKTVLAIHPVWMGIPNQNRLHRLYSETPDDNRITNGCINVLSDFFYGVLNTLPDGTMLYILPEK